MALNDVVDEDAANAEGPCQRRSGCAVSPLLTYGLDIGERELAMGACGAFHHFPARIAAAASSTISAANVETLSTLPR